MDLSNYALSSCRNHGLFLRYCLSSKLCFTTYQAETDVAIFKTIIILMDLLTYKRDSVLKNQSVRESALKGMNLLKIEIHMTQMNA